MKIREEEHQNHGHPIESTEFQPGDCLKLVKTDNKDGCLGNYYLLRTGISVVPARPEFRELTNLVSGKLRTQCSSRSERFIKMNAELIIHPHKNTQN